MHKHRTQEVLETLQRLGSATRQTIAEELGVDIYVVGPALHRLRQSEAVEVVDRVKNSYGPPVAVYRAKGGAVKVKIIGGCSHMSEITTLKKEKKHECEECVKTGDTWVHLRTCQKCGTTLCCESSRNQHMRHHVMDTNHPVVISAEPGERWAYCYPDNTYGDY